jgi:carbonic anhydrase
MSDFYKKILENNKQWVEKKLAISPEFFNNLAEGQQPPI